MPIIVKKYRVRVGGEIFLPGSVITGLNEDEEKNLVDGGSCEYPFVIDSQAESGSPLHISVEQFKELKSAGQNELLGKLGIEAGSNPKIRTQQYSDFLKSNDPFKDSEEESEDPADEEDGAGPNTSITS